MRKGCLLLATLVAAACGSSSSKEGGGAPDGSASDGSGSSSGGSSSGGGPSDDGGGGTSDATSLGNPDVQVPPIPSSLACTVPFAAVDTSTPTTVVGQGGQACNEASLVAAVAKGGIITFDLRRPRHDRADVPARVADRKGHHDRRRRQRHARRRRDHPHPFVQGARLPDDHDAHHAPEPHLPEWSRDRHQRSRRLAALLAGVHDRRRRRRRVRLGRRTPRVQLDIHRQHGGDPRTRRRRRRHLRRREPGDDDRRQPLCREHRLERRRRGLAQQRSRHLHEHPLEQHGDRHGRQQHVLRVHHAVHGDRRRRKRRRRRTWTAAATAT